MYELKRKEEKTAQLKVDEHILTATIGNLDTILPFYYKNQAKILQLQNEQTGNTIPDPDTIQNIGELIIELMAMLFGDEQADIIIAFFENRYLEMIEQLGDFMEREINPIMRELTKQNEERAGRAFKLGQTKKLNNV